LREYIKRSGYTLQEVAQLTNIPSRTLSDYCAGKTPIPHERLQAIAQLLGYPADVLVPPLLGQEIPEGVMPEDEPVASINPSIGSYFPLQHRQDSSAAPFVLFQSHHMVDLLRNFAQSRSDEHLGMWLALETSDLVTLLHEGWSIDEILEVLRVMLHGLQAMPRFSRRDLGRKLLYLGASAVVSNISLPSGRSVSEEERANIHKALGESIAMAWALVQSANNAQVLAIGEAQLYLLQQCQSLLSPRIQASLCSPVYRLIGAALHFQGRYDAALDVHNKAYVAALECADQWNMAQTRSWQALALKEQRRYTEALEYIEAGLALVSEQRDDESIRTASHLLASGAEIASLLKDEKGVNRRLAASQELLAPLTSYHEEFDDIAWLGMGGVCALHLQQYDVAVNRLQQAVDMLPTQATLRLVTTLMPLVMAYAYAQEKDLSLTTAQKTLPLLHSMNAPGLTHQFIRYMTKVFSEAFPGDTHMEEFVVNVQRQLVLKPQLPA
jgi:tetratricopeptide (TPR) repeat protein